MTATAISNVYDGLVTLVTAALPTHKKLANPYMVEANPSVVLKNGYGIKIGAAENTQRFCGSHHSTRRSLSVVLTAEMAAVEANATQWRSAELGLMEEAQTIIKAIASNPTLGGYAANTDWTNDGGIEFVDGDRTRYLTIEITFSTEYIEAN